MNTRLRMRGRSEAAPVYTLVLDADGKATLEDSAQDVVWSSDNEDDDDFQATFGDFVEEERADEVIDWLFENVALPDNAEIETRVEYDDSQGPGDDEDEEDEEDYATGDA